MTVDLSSEARTDAAIDIIGVMPEPAAISTWRPGTDRSGVKVPLGTWTSRVSPGLIVRTSQPETAPSATSRTPMRGAAPTGAQIEYERRSSPRRTVSDWPGWKAKSAARPAGTLNVIAAESSVSGSMLATTREWKSVRDRRPAGLWSVETLIGP